MDLAPATRWDKVILTLSKTDITLNKSTMRHYQGWYISNNIWSSISETKKQKKIDVYSTIYIDSPDLSSIASVKCNLFLVQWKTELECLSFLSFIVCRMNTGLAERLKSQHPHMRLSSDLSQHQSLKKNDITTLLIWWVCTSKTNHCKSWMSGLKVNSSTNHSFLGKLGLLTL